MKKNKEITLLNSRAWLDDENYPYEDYVDYCEEYEIEPKSEESHEFFQWKLKMSSMDFENDLEYIQSVKEYKYAIFVISGSLGLWNGRPNIVPQKVCGLYESIEKCFGDCNDLIVTLDTESGVINVQALHHDGINCFEIRRLRDYCNNAYNRAYEDWQYSDVKVFEPKRGWFRKIHNPYRVR